MDSTRSENEPIDYGDDLLDLTAEHSVAKVQSDFLAPYLPDVKDLAEVQKTFAEGNIDLAKRMVQTMMIVRPDLHESRQLLEEIEEFEMNKFLDASVDVSEKSSLELSEKLHSEVGASSPDIIPQLSEFELNEMKRLSHELKTRDLIDFGVHWLVLGYRELARMLLNAAILKAGEDEFQAAEQRVSAAVLIAQATLELNRPIEALMYLEQAWAEAMNDPIWATEVKYWMGVAEYSRGNRNEARTCFLTVARLNSEHRDLQDWLRRCNG